MQVWTLLVVVLKAPYFKLIKQITSQSFTGSSEAKLTDSVSVPGTDPLFSQDVHNSIFALFFYQLTFLPSFLTFFRHLINCGYVILCSICHCVFIGIFHIDSCKPFFSCSKYPVEYKKCGLHIYTSFFFFSPTMAIYISIEIISPTLMNQS